MHFQHSKLINVIHLNSFEFFTKNLVLFSLKHSPFCLLAVLEILGERVLLGRFFSLAWDKIVL